MEEIPVIIIDSESTKDIFFNVGLTFYAAHSFEESLRGLLVGNYIIENPSDWQENYSKETNNLNKLPLGKLLEKIKSTITLEPNIEAFLRSALIKRNHFIHFYFYESFGLLSDIHGHQKIINDMIELRALFQKAENIIKPISHELMIKAGMTKEQMFESARIGINNQLRKNNTTLDKWKKIEKQNEEIAAKISTLIIEKYQQKLKDMNIQYATKNIGAYRTAESISTLNNKDFSEIILLIIDRIRSFELYNSKKITQLEFKNDIDSTKDLLNKLHTKLSLPYISQFLFSQTEELAAEAKTLLDSVTTLLNLIPEIKEPVTVEENLEAFVNKYNYFFVPYIIRVMKSKKNSVSGNSRLTIICLYLNATSKSTSVLLKLAEEIICELNKELDVLKIEEIRSYTEEELPQKIKDLKEGDTWKELKSYAEEEVLERLGVNHKKNKSRSAPT